jgi:hypothetical protein
MATTQAKPETVYFVRGGKKSGCYLTARIRPSKRKYAWTNKKAFVCEMTYAQAKAALKSYGGRNLVKRTYVGSDLVKEEVVA